MESVMKRLFEGGDREEARRMIGATSKGEKLVKTVKQGEKVQVTAKGKIMEINNTVWIADEGHAYPFMTTTLEGKTTIYTPPIVIEKRKRRRDETHGEYLADVIGPYFQKVFTELGYTVDYCTDLVSQLRNSKHEYKLNKLNNNKKKKRSESSSFCMDQMKKVLAPDYACACGNCCV